MLAKACNTFILGGARETWRRSSLASLSSRGQRAETFKRVAFHVNLEQAKEISSLQAGASSLTLNSIESAAAAAGRVSQRI